MNTQQHYTTTMLKHNSIQNSITALQNANIKTVLHYTKQHYKTTTRKLYYKKKKNLQRLKTAKKQRKNNARLRASLPLSVCPECREASELPYSHLHSGHHHRDDPVDTHYTHTNIRETLKTEELECGNKNLN